MIAQIIFWLSLAVLAHTYLTYLVSLMALGKIHRDRGRAGELPTFSPAEEPSVTVIIAAHNEEAVIADRVRNCLDLDYPASRLEIIVVSDHSTDGTDEIVQAFHEPNVRLLRSTGRGKSIAQNEAVSQAAGEIVVFTDADTVFSPDFLTRLVKPFANPKVGCVAGRLIWSNPGETAITGGGSLYWRIEHLLWRLESRHGILAWVTGACMAFRRSLFMPMEPQYGDDVVVPLDVIRQGHEVRFEPEAVAYEDRISQPGAELRARIRMTIRSLSGTLSRSQLLNPLRYPGVAWSIVSHKLLRWFAPSFMLLAFFANLFLLDQTAYRLLFALQVAFYAAAVVGHLTERSRVKVRLASTIYAFCVMNLGIFLGVANVLLGRRISAYRSEG